MDCDPFPGDPALLREFLASDERRPPRLPAAGPLRERAAAFLEAVPAADPLRLRETGQGLLDHLAACYRVEPPPLTILGARPRASFERSGWELHGDYDLETSEVRLWVRTAARQRVASPRALLCTLLHEVCHHLDRRRWSFPSTFHTRGFFRRLDALYPHALGTPAAERGPLEWRLHLGPRGGRWRFDWPRLRRRGEPSRPDAADEARFRAWADELLGYPTRGAGVPAAGWPFPEPPEAEVVTQRAIAAGARPVLLVTHEPDGVWTFLDGTPPREEDLLVSTLGSVAAFDPTVAELARLPRGWRAWRAGAGAPWTCAPRE